MDFKEVNAVHEKDLKNLLERLGIKDLFEEGSLRCKFCKTTITQANLYSVLPESGGVNLICDQPKCITQFLEYLDEKNKTRVEK